MPSTSRVNYFDKPNSNDLQLSLAARSIRWYRDLCGNFDLMLSRSATAIQFFDVLHDMK